MKTIKEWAAELPPEQGAALLKYLKPTDKRYSLRSAVGSFNWNNTSEGWDYWSRIYTNLNTKTKKR
jgi:hypothetical protein